MKTSTLDKHELLAIIAVHRDSSLGAEDSELTNERAQSLDHYYGRPYGDEEDGRSQVVSKDLKETLDWIKPALIKIFVQSGNIAEFIPVGEDDEQTAKQETETVNHVIMSKNNGVLLLHDLFHDALLLKNAYCKHYYEEKEIISESEYSGLTEDELLQVVQELEQNGEVEVVEQDQSIAYIPMQDGEQAEITVFDVRLRSTTIEKNYIVEPIPPEEVRVSSRCKGSTQTSPFTEHVTTKTRTDLIEMGMDKDFVNDLPSRNDEDNDTLTNSRDTVEDDYQEDSSFNDRSMDEIEYCESYIRVDFDGDGKAELRKVISVGNKIPPGKEWNEVVDCVAITALTPKRVPHRHIGESLDDDIADLQQISTVLKRQMLDNIYRINSTEKVVNERVDLDDSMRSEAGNVIRVEGDMDVQSAIMYTKPQSIIMDILPAIDMINKDKEGRTGINETNTSLDPNVLKDVNNKVYLEGVAKASQKVEMIARLLAEGVKEICLRTHELLIKHQDKEMSYKLNGQYVSVNPQEWKNRTDMRITVGLGTGTEEEKRMKLSAFASEQERMMGFGLVGPQQAFNLFTDIGQSLGSETPEKYVMRPGSEEHQQFMQMSNKEQPNPLAEAEQVKGQINMQVKQFESDSKERIEAERAGLEKYKAQIEDEYKARDLDLRERDLRVREVEADIKGKTEAARIEADRYKADLKAETDMAINQLKLGATFQEAVSSKFTDMSEDNDERLTAMINSLLGELNEMNSQNIAGMEGVAEGLREQVDGLAAQMARPKRVIYAEDGETPIGVETID